jgi:undecaprenyl-diphosphatase
VEDVELNSMFDWLRNIDTRLFLLINGHHCAFCDFISFWASEKLTWVPFYLFLAVLIYKNDRNELLKVLLTVALIIVFTDQLSVFIKDHVMRYRPCYNLIIKSQVHLINGVCGGQYGFVSSHAANSSGIAVFLILLFRNKIKWITTLVIIWCLIISYSRIYLGPHYPLDVMGGWLTGVPVALIVFYFYKRLFLKEKNKTLV